MAASTLPIKYREVLNLQQLGVPQDCIKFQNITMNSSDVIVVNNNSSLNIIQTSTKSMEQFNAPVESAIMNPRTKVLGLRGSTPNGEANLQIYNLEMKVRAKICKVSETVVFWKWLDAKTVGIVTGQAVYHWSMDGDAEPEKQFNRQDGDEVQILDYCRSSGGDWLLLRGIGKSNNGFVGKLTVYQISTNKTQTIEAHGGTFATVTLEGQSTPSTLLCCARSDASGTKLLLKEVEGSAGFINTADVPLQNPQDFIISMVPDVKHGMIFALSQAGFIFLFDVQTGTCIYSHQTQQTMFLSVPNESDGGVYALDRTGRLYSFAVDDQNIVNHVSSILGMSELAVTIAGRCNLGGAEDVFKMQFQRAMQQGNYQEAARIATEAPQGVLRTPETIRAFQNAPVPPGQNFPDLLYFNTLLQKGSLNAEESVGLCERVLSLNKDSGLTHMENWLTQNKLTRSEALGDQLVQFNAKLACSVYLHANVPEKTILCFLRMGHHDKVIEYAKKNNYTPNYPVLLNKLHSANPQDAKPFAISISQQGLITPDECIQIFLGGGKNDVPTCVGYLLEYLQERGDRDEDADLQTKLMELALTSQPRVAESIMQSESISFTKYNRLYIARMCEGAGLYQAALEHYEDLDDIKRLLQMALSSGAVEGEQLVNFFGRLAVEDALVCLDDLLQFQNAQGNLQLVVEVAKQFSDTFLPANLIELFERHDCWSGLYFYLGSFVNFTQDPEVVFKYIQAAVEFNRIQQVELICRENSVYDPEQVKKYLIESTKLKDPRPLIHVCDRHGYVHELTTHLYTNQLQRFIEVYVTKMNPSATPEVVGGLLDLNAPEDSIRDLVN